MKNLVVFASGSGSNFQAIIDAFKGKEYLSVVGLITDRPGIGAIRRAQHHQIPFNIIEPDQSGSDIKKILQQLDAWEPDLISLAGYLKKIPEEVIREYPNQIINIHPSLLPEFGGHGFYGKRVHQAVIEAGRLESGCTVHFVNENYDEGEVIAQSKVPVYPDDTPEKLAERVLHEEHKLYPAVITHLLTQN